MRRHVDFPAFYLFSIPVVGPVALICYQESYAIPAYLLGIVASILFVIGAVKIKVFYA